MSQPGLLVFFKDSELEKQLFASPVASKFSIVTPSTSQSWLDTLENENLDVAIIEADDFNVADLEGLSASDKLKSMELIFVSSGEPNASLDTVMQRGASFHLRKPVNFAVIEELLEEFFSELTALGSNKVSGRQSELDQYGLLVGSSKVMRRLYRIIRKAAYSEASVIIIGESGSGKELVAHTLHLMSPRNGKPFVSLNCGAISHELIESELFGHLKGSFTGAHQDRSGVFEQAEGGTLFLDEITEMPLAHQVKLLRVLETGEYKPVGGDALKTADVRIIAATNREPSLAIKEDMLREDLYFRLAEFPVRVPPLREREDDIAGLAQHFLAYRNAEEQTAVTMTAKALDVITAHHWSGNVRELKHTIERAYILAEEIIGESEIAIEEAQAQPEDSHLVIPQDMSLEDLERQAILQGLKENDGNKKTTAEQLGVSVKTLYNKLEKYKLED